VVLVLGEKEGMYDIWVIPQSQLAFDSFASSLRRISRHVRPGPRAGIELHKP